MADNDDLMVKVIRKDTGSGYIPGFLLGALAGAAIGLIRAPKPGLQMRRQLTQRLNSLRGSAQSRLPGRGSS